MRVGTIKMHRVYETVSCDRHRLQGPHVPTPVLHTGSNMETVSQSPVGNHRTCFAIFFLAYFSECLKCLINSGGRRGTVLARAEE